MLSGKRHFIENLLINNLILLKKQKQKTTFFYLLDIIEITKPVLELYLKRRGKFFYKVPFPVDSIRQYKLSILFIGEAIKQKKFSNFKHAFFHETLNIIYSEKSLIYDKLKRIIETSVENRSYLHYRWWK
jgi:ribosomal protein S7